MLKTFVFILFSAALFGQQTEQAPAKLKRKAANANTAAATSSTKDLSAALSALVDAGSVTAAVGSIVLSPTALDAIKVSQAWENEHVTPATGQDGRVLYRFGSGLPTIVCAPLRVCTMELQPGERIQGDPQIGDAIRWDMSLATVGLRTEATAIIVLKPQQSGLDTNLLITTDRRAYYVRLVSEPDAYVARVGFSYPEDDAAKWRVQVAEQEVKPTAISYNVDGGAALIAVAKLHFDYALKGGSSSIRPLRVFDDGAKTYLQMPPAMINRDAPILVIVGSDKKIEMVNYRVKEQTYIVDRLFEKAQLRLGSGKHGQKVEITHAAAKG